MRKGNRTKKRIDKSRIMAEDVNTLLILIRLSSSVMSDYMTPGL